ncbi:MAG: alanine racemase [bacterium]|nr:alanine racemase [bacterium]
MFHDYYRTWATVDLDKLRNNLSKITAKLPKAENPLKILAVVKANAYGHGAKEVANIFRAEKRIFLGVASVEEACELEKLGLPIVILSPVDAVSVSKIIESGFIPTISNLNFAKFIAKEAHKKNKIVKIHIEVDTGMIRTGIPYENSVKTISEIIKLKNLKVDGIFTHFSEPDNLKSDFTYIQLKRFRSVMKELERKKINIPLVHTASSAAILNFPDSYFNMIRPGILMYGLYPSEGCNKSVCVEPILSLYTRICQINEIPANTGVSYSRTYKSKGRRKIATLLVGYGDGYPRSLSNKGIVIVKGKRAKIVGNVCMDLTMIDVTDILDVKIGDKVTLIGKEGKQEITANEIAKLAGTINYEIITRMSPRVPRIYIKENKPYKVHSLLGEENITLRE